MTPDSLSEHERTLLAGRFAAAQNLDFDRAEALADRVLAGPPDIARSAVEWAETGQLPPGPEVLGETPQTLGKRFAPTQVFTGLMLLRSDPHTGLRVIRRGVDLAPGASERLKPVDVEESAAADRRFALKPIFPSWKVTFPALASAAGAVAVLTSGVLALTGTISNAVAVIVVAVYVAVSQLWSRWASRKDPDQLIRP